MSKEMQSFKAAMVRMQELGITQKFDGELDYMKLRNANDFAIANVPCDTTGVEIVQTKFGVMEAELIVPDNDKEDGILIYIHGGGMVCGNTASSRAYGVLIAKEMGLKTYTFSYRLAPEDPYPAAIEDCFIGYKEITEKYPDKPVVLIGDSGGGYLTVVTTLKARDNGVRMPACAIPYSPLIDVSCEIVREREGIEDLIVSPNGLRLVADLYCPDVSKRTDPECSPYYADFKGVSPMFVAWDRKETMAVDSEFLVKALKENGVEVEYKAYDDCFHAFPCTGKGTPEGLDALNRTIAFINKHIGR